MSAVLSASPPAIDLAAVKTRQQAAWSTGNYAVVGTTLQIVGESLCEALDLRSGTRVLDVAAGNGNATLAAARRWCDVTSTDYVASLLESGRARAQAEGHTIRFQEADAENLPFADASFDAVMSTFGVMFTPDQEQGRARARARLQARRQDRPGELDAGELHRAGVQDHRPVHPAGAGRQVTGASGAPRPGSRSCSATTAREIRTTSREFVFRYRSPAHWIEVFRTYYGPMNKTFGALDAAQQAAFTRDLLALMEQRNRSGDGTLVLPSEYLEVVIERK